MKKFIVLGLLMSSVAFAATTKSEVYKIVGITEASPNNWVALETISGSVVYVRCSTMDFDDAPRDRVARFDTVEECHEFLGLIRKHATRANPAEVKIGIAGIDIKVSI